MQQFVIRGRGSLNAANIAALMAETGMQRPMLVCSQRMEKDFAMIEEHYEGDGWYFDYPTKRDYYTIWAFHYYSLVYAAAMRDIAARTEVTFTWGTSTSTK